MNKSTESKKKLMVVKSYPANSNKYIPQTVGFSFLDPPNGKDSNVRYESTPLNTCREGLIGMLLSAALNNGVYYKSESTNKNSGAVDPKDLVVDTGRMRLLAVSKCDNEEMREDKKKRFFAAKKILNIYETYAGFEKTKVSTVKHDTTGYAWLFTGARNKGWMLSAAIFTFACLVIRISSQIKMDWLKDLADSDDVDSITKQWAECMKKEEPDSITDLKIFMSKIYDKIPLILKFHKELFKDINPFPPGNMDFRHKAGITSTCRCESFDPTLNERLKNLFKDKKL